MRTFVGGGMIRNICGPTMISAELDAWLVTEWVSANGNTSKVAHKLVLNSRVDADAFVARRIGELVTLGYLDVSREMRSAMPEPDAPARIIELED